MAKWNYRVIEFVTTEGEAWRAVHEVFYDDAGAPTGYAEIPAIVMWDVEEGGDEVGLSTLAKMRDAFGKPVLVEADFRKEP